MPEDFIIDEYADVLIPSGHRLAGSTMGSTDEAVQGDMVLGTNPPIVDADDVVTPTGFVLPDLYDFLPQVVRDHDTELVNREDVPIYFWDSAPSWDTEPFEWDAVIGPEPILRSTLRTMQVELDTSAREIQDLGDIYNLDRTRDAFLPYIASLLGTPLPAGSSKNQRAFLDRIVDLYKRKGTPLSFVQMFSSLGFDVELVEKYQRFTDGAFVGGPQSVITGGNLIVREQVGTLDSGAGPYRIQSLYPYLRGTLELRVFTTDDLTPEIIIDDGAGGWSNEVTGSVNYDAGTGTFTLSSVPTNTGGAIELTYRYVVDRFPHDGSHWSDRFRSSEVALTLSPQDANVVLTEELNQRLRLYRDLLKPAHVIFADDAIVIAIPFTEDVNATEIIEVFTLAFFEPLWTHEYAGYGYAAEENGSQGPTREDEEWITTYAQEADNNPQAPYVYPRKMDGLFLNTEQTSATDPTPLSQRGMAIQEYNGRSDLYVAFTTTVTGIITPTTTRFSTTDVPFPSGVSPFSDGIAPATGNPGSGRASPVVFEDGYLEGESRLLQSAIYSTGSHWDITLTTPLPTPPQPGDKVTFFDAKLLRMDQANIAMTMDMYWGEALALGGSPGVGPHVVGGGKGAVLANNVLLRFTIGGTTYEESDDGVGVFTNTSGFISLASIVYGTGVATVTFTSAPDGSTDIELFYGQTATVGLGF
jgi:hypothetical protein